MLTEEIERAQRFVRTDAYQMSIGEIVSMYETAEFVIDPEFQRLFRWDIGQKSKLIESLLLGIPIPSIFVFEQENGTWELIDGLQRISTILEFMGRLRISDRGTLPPSLLEGTSYLPALHNAVWEKSEHIPGISLDEQVPLDKSHQLAIRRSRISVEILKRPSENETKFDLFQRLNAGGTLANAQELRNCVMLMVNAEYFRAIKDAANGADFRSVTAVSESQVEKQRHLELAVRFLVHVYVPYDGGLDVEEYIDDGVVRLCKDGDQDGAVALISNTFRLLESVAGDESLRRYADGTHSGKVGLVGLEGIAVGVAKNLDEITKLGDPVQFVREKIQGFWSQPQTLDLTSPGLRGTIRIQRTVPFGEAWFKP